MVIQQLNALRVSIIESYNSMINTYSYEYDKDFKLENVKNEYRSRRAIEYTFKSDNEPPFIIVYSRLSKPINSLYKQIKNIPENFVYRHGVCILFRNIDKTLYTCESDGRIKIYENDISGYVYLSDHKDIEKLIKMLDRAYEICFQDEIEYGELPIIHMQQCKDIQSKLCEYNKNLWDIFKKNQDRFLEYADMKDVVKLRTSDKDCIELRVKLSSTEDPFNPNEKMKYIELTREVINILDSGNFGVAYQFKKNVGKSKIETIYVIRKNDSTFKVILADDLINKSIPNLKYENIPYKIIICKLLRIMKLHASDSLFGLYNYNKLRVYDFTNFNIKYDLCTLSCDGKFE